MQEKQIRQPRGDILNTGVEMTMNVSRVVRRLRFLVVVAVSSIESAIARINHNSAVEATHSTPAW